MKSLEQIKNETAEELGYINYFDFEDAFNNNELDFRDIENFIDHYAVFRVEEVENYYKSNEDEK